MPGGGLTGSTSVCLQKPGGEEVVKQNIAKRDEILQVIQENIDDLRFQERNAGSAGGGGAAGSGGAGAAQGRDRMMGAGKSECFLPAHLPVCVGSPDDE